MKDDWKHMEFVKLGSDIPEVSCIYFLMNDNELVYIGQTVNLKSRMQSHKANLNCTLFLGDKKLEEDTFDSIYYSIVDYKPERKTYEEMFRDDYWPKLNGYNIERDYLVPKREERMERMKLEAEGIDPDKCYLFKKRYSHEEP